MKRIAGVVLIIALFLFSGCATMQKAKRTEQLEQEISDLKLQIEELQEDKERELTELERAKRDLERKLQKELSAYQAKLKMTDRGLVVTFLAEIFFDSGKAEIKESAKETLSKVADVLKNNASETTIVIEGHTDNEPIKYSGWKSNWELASARALAVLHYFIDEGEIAPQRISATSFGEHQPVNDNETPEGRKRNRRVEIVIIPVEITKEGR